MGLMGGGGLPGLGGAANSGMVTGLNGINGGPGGGGGMFSNTNGGLQLSQIPFIGGLFPNPNEGAARDAMAAAGAAYGAMRPSSAQGYQNLVSQNQNALAPAHQALANMYGGQHGQNSDVTAAMADQSGSTGGNYGAAVGSMLAGGPKPSDNSGKGNPAMSFLNTLDPLGGLGSLGGAMGGFMGLGGGQGGPMGAVQGGMSNPPGGGLLGGILGGGGGGGGLLGGLLGGGGGGGPLGMFGL